jgi:hypothetical protein
MIDLSRFGNFRENMFRKLKDQIKCTILSKDTVIPPAGVIETLNETRKKDVVSILDFNYPYSHENPFPIFNNPLSNEVDRSFDLVFEEAGAFLR